MIRGTLAGGGEEPVIAVIGAGFAGIGAAVRLRRAGFRRVTLLERAEGPGGTWWHNTYEGAEVDTPSMLYSYSWMPWNWTRTHVRQAELRDYLAAVLDAFDLRDRCRFGVTVDRVEWDAGAREYSLRSGRDEIMRARYVVSAVGLLSDPRMPDLPGLNTFEGPVFHSSQWRHDVDLSGKRVAVVGSGSTATQLVPALRDKAKQVTMFSREPNWIVPKRARPYTDKERRALDSRVAQRIVRASTIYRRDKAQFGGALWRSGSPQNTAAENAARGYLEASLGERPDLLEALTPRYPYGGKRPVISDDFYTAVLADNVQLVPHAVREVTEHGLVDATGVEREFDVLIMATGFKADFLSTLQVTGRDGQEIHRHWNGDERAFLGVMVPGFPNFFIMYGPNTNGGTIVTNLELQASFLTAAVKRAERGGAGEVEVRGWAAEAYDRAVQRMLQGTAFQYGNNYYRSGSGRISTQWPDGVLLYALLTKLLRGPFLRVTPGTRGRAGAGGAEGRERAASEVSS
ncbi:flavin-containing monooxygenase [Streptomyces gilvus]|uniref:flavin-containing monooxygenase n=1 Tax=Streptomyces gilvus TaxID=2920937 RepID=UPI001F0DD66A|nr:NAD(P)/FAD-dependent oxidoreductase [Streptomyces sp. CME 23]MCH5677564.1 NAD(P)/FAD-dependent oxidoreductase [Streptomyces sp. CME 23]